MGHFRYSFLVAAVIAAITATGAKAGGFRFPPGPVVPVPAAVAIPDASTWYLRGDIAWSPFESPELTQPGISYFGEDIDDTLGLGGGFGYYIHDNFRGDVTVDHRFKADVTGTNSLTLGRLKTDLASTVVLANFYFDFGERDHIAPYLGAGIGITQNDTGSEENVDFAAAIMAGISFSIRDGLLFDVGYRFLHLGEAEIAATGALGAVAIDNIEAHELRLGFRYEIN